MSKSLGNQIGVTDEPQEMYGKTMAIPDEAMGEYYRLLLGCEPAIDRRSASDALGEISPSDQPGELSPRDAKRALARKLVAWLYSEVDAQAAQEHFDRVFVQRGVPEEIQEARFECADGMLHLPGLIASELGMSRSEARRMIDQGGVTLGEAQLAAGQHDVSCAQADGQVLKVGRRRFRRLRAG
jgi:tyrosyl-tRNA synthetase